MSWRKLMAHAWRYGVSPVIRLWRQGLLIAIAVAATSASGKPSKKAVSAAEYQPTVDQYTVQKGDTLWDISEKYAGSPWFWPRIWSYNPEITNPHWIYPGDMVRFQPGDQPLPRLTQLASGDREMPTEPEPQVTKADPEVQEINQPPPRKWTGRRSRELLSLFVSPKELAESGTLTNSIADKMLLTPPDDVFISFPQGQRSSPGQRYMVYRTVQEVKHPRTHQRYGYMTQVTGFATVQSHEQAVSRATLTEAVVEIERGQRVAPIAKLPSLDQRPTNAQTRLAGVVLAVQPGEHIAGQRQVVFVDLGASSGLRATNRLAVYVDKDPLRPEVKLPLTQIATLMAVDVRDNATTCVVLTSKQEIEAGLIVQTLTR